MWSYRFLGYLFIAGSFIVCLFHNDVLLTPVRPFWPVLAVVFTCTGLVIMVLAGIGGNIIEEIRQFKNNKSEKSGKDAEDPSMIRKITP